MNLSHARVLLTGAGGGIGRAMATALAAEGAQVMGVGRGPAPPDSATCGWLNADLREPDDIARLAATAADWNADTVVHAAGLPAFGAFETDTPAHMQAVLQVNLWAPMALTQALLPHLRRQPEARVVFVGSALGRIGVPGSSVYGASKAGLHGFAEALRRELADTPVRVQTLAPRATQTAFNTAPARAFNAATGTASDPPDAVARALLQLLRSGAAERFIGFPERVAVRLNGAAAPWLDRGFRPHRRALFSPTPSGDPA